MIDINSIIVQGMLPTAVEIDPSCHCAYIRFSHSKVEKSLSDQRGKGLAVYDLDKNGKIIGIEIVGVKSFSIEAIRHFLPPKFRDVDFDKARFTPVSAAPCNRGMQPA